MIVYGKAEESLSIVRGVFGTEFAGGRSSEVWLQVRIPPALQPVLRIIIRPVHGLGRHNSRPTRRHAAHIIVSSLSNNRLLPCHAVVSKQVMQPPQPANLRDTKINKIHHLLHLFCDCDTASNTRHSARRAPVVHAPGERFQVIDSHCVPIVDDVPFQGGQTPHFVGPVERVQSTSNHRVHCIHNPSGPSPEDYDFSGVQTLKLFEAPDSRNDLGRCAKKH